MADAQIERIMLGLVGEAEDGVKLVGFEVGGAIVEAAPVDTGNLRASVITSVGVPYEGVPSSQDAVSTVAQNAGQAELARYKLDMGEVHIVLAAEYTEAVDQRDPFVRDAVERGVAAAIAKGGVSR